MNTEIKEFISLYMAYRRNQSKLEKLRDKAKKSAANVMKVTRLLAEMNEQRKQMDQMAILISTAINTMEKPTVKAANGLPLFQAFNEYFKELFDQHPAMETALITDISNFHDDINARFKTNFSLKDVSAKLVEQGEAVMGGFQFKRADFYLPETN